MSELLRFTGYSAFLVQKMKGIRACSRIHSLTRHTFTSKTSYFYPTSLKYGLNLTNIHTNTHTHFNRCFSQQQEQHQSNNDNNNSENNNNNEENKDNKKEDEKVNWRSRIFRWMQYSTAIMIPYVIYKYLNDELHLINIPDNITTQQIPIS